MPIDTSEKGLGVLVMRHMTGEDSLAVTLNMVADSRLEREIELLRKYRARLVADVVTSKLDVREAAARLPEEAAADTALIDAEAPLTEAED